MWLIMWLNFNIVQLVTWPIPRFHATLLFLLIPDIFYSYHVMFWWHPNRFVPVGCLLSYSIITQNVLSPALLLIQTYLYSFITYDSLGHVIHNPLVKKVSHTCLFLLQYHVYVWSLIVYTMLFTKYNLNWKNWFLLWWW